MSTMDNDLMAMTPIPQTADKQADLMMTSLPFADDEQKQTILPSQNKEEQSQYAQNMTPIQTSSEDEFISSRDETEAEPKGTLGNETDSEIRAEDLQLDFGDDDDHNLPFSYLENEHNLQFPVLSADTIDEMKPHSSFQAVGDWLKQATDIQTYWNALESFGGDVAQYKWAYDEGDLGEFDAASFSKEALKATARGFSSDNLRMMGNVLSAFGTNIENKNLGIGIMTAGTTLHTPEVGAVFKNIGDKFQQYAKRIETSSVLAPVQAAYMSEPSWEKLANVLGQGSAQVLSMGAMAKYLGAAAAYALFAGGGAAQVFNESYDKEQNVDTANTLALLSGGTTFAIDKIFNPLPKQIENRAKMTSKMIAKEVLGAPLREAGTEVLQQLLAENLVRQVGIDDTQDLFEGLVESAIGAIAGTSALMAVDGSTYYAQKSYEDARRRMMLKGVSDEDIELFKKNALELLQSKPGAFTKVFSYSLEQNLKALELEASQAKPLERSARKADVDAFRKIYDEMYQRAFNATQDDTKAKITAGMIQANIMAFYNVDKSFSPQKILQDNLPKIKQMTYDKFKQQVSSEDKLLFQFGGVDAKYADIVKLKEALKLEDEEVNPRVIWSRTGWFHGQDGKWRFEISDADAKLKLNFDVNESELPKRYWQTYIQKLEKQEAQEIISLRALEKKVTDDAEVIEEIYNYLYGDFIDFLDKNYTGHFSFGIDKNGSFSFTDPEVDFEENIKKQQEKVNDNVVALVSSYDARNATNKLKQDSSMSSYIRDKTLKQLLIDKEKFNVLDDEDIAELTSANQNTATSYNIQKPNSGRLAVVVRSSDFKNNTTKAFNKDMSKLLNSYKGMKIYNPSLDSNIEIGKTSFKNLSDDAKLLIPYFPMLLEKAVFGARVEKAPQNTKSEIKASYYSYLPVEIDGNRGNVRIEVNENSNGDLLWNLQIKNMSAQEIEAHITHTTGEDVAFDDYLTEQERKTEELRNSSKAPWIKRKAANTNFQSPDKFYTDEQLKIIRAALEERSFFHFMEEIWPSPLDEDANLQRLDKFLEDNHAKTKGFKNLAQKLDDELVHELAKRRETMKNMGFRKNFDMYDDLTINKFYQLYLAGQGNYHKPYFNANYLSNLYRKAHIPMSMSEKFLALPRYRSWDNMYKSLMKDFLDRIYRIYRFHKEIDFAKQAELRDIQAANEFIKQRVDEGDESLRTYWMERQLLLDKKEMKLGDLLEHPELYKNYPDLKNVIVRFVELDSDDGYHFYRDKNFENDVLEIDPRQFDYTNLKDLLMRGTAFAIQMREHFDLALSPSQRRNFMDRHIYLAKKKAAKHLGTFVDEFVSTYLPEQDPDSFWIYRDVPLPLIDVYESQSKQNKTKKSENPDSVRHLKFRDVDFDLLFKKVDEKYASHILDPHERQLGDFVYASLRDLISKFNNFELVASRVSSGYFHTAPFPWAGGVSQGEIEVRNILQRQNYSDWQRSFAFWDDRVRKPSLDKKQLSFSALHKFMNAAEGDKEFIDFDPEKMNSLPDDDNKIRGPYDSLSLVIQRFARGAYEIADKTIYLFEKADEQTIMHETFHYLSQLLKTSIYNTDSKLRYAYNGMLDNLRKEVLYNYKIVKNKGKYSFVRYQKSHNFPDILGSFSTTSEALDYAVEELFVYQLRNSFSYKMYPQDEYFDLLNYFYCAWMINVSQAVALNEKKYSDTAKHLMEQVNYYLTKAWHRLADKLK